MNMFYDSKKKQVKVWVFACFVVISILIVIAGFGIAKSLSDRNKLQNQAQQEPDIFK